LTNNILILNSENH